MAAIRDAGEAAPGLEQEEARMRDDRTTKAGGLTAALTAALLTPAAASGQSGVARVDSVEDPTDRVVAFLEDGTVGGEVGVYLKEVGGDAIAEHNARFEFEPASAIKALIHFHGMRQIQEGKEIDGEPVTLDRQIPWFTELLGSDEPPGGCPALTGADSDTLRKGLREMMRNSDNRWTQAIRDFFGNPNIDATRDIGLGMLDTRLSHLIGCFESKPDGHTNAAEDPNRLTLVDAGKMYEAVATGFLTPLRRTQAFELMSSENNRFNEMIDEEASGMGISEASLAKFKKARDAVLKTGAYRKPNLDPPQQYRAVAGWAELPWKDVDCASRPREYVYGAFIHRAESLPERFESSIRSAGVELFRGQIRGALESWAACEADLELLGSTVLDAPSEALLGDPLAVVVRNEIVNHGPASPIDAELLIEAQATAGGTVSPQRLVLSEPALGPERWVLSDPFTIFCDRPGAQTFTFQSRISAANPEVFDPNDLDNLEVTSVVVECVLGIAIDIDNPVPLPPGTGVKANLGPRVQVTALSTHSDEPGAPVAFDATLIDRASVRFGQRAPVWNGTGGAAKDGGERIRDVDKNGSDDMVLSFRTGETGLVAGDGEACMKGLYEDGGQLFRFFGCDLVETRP
ncbi:MAG TPA: serine hydrolase [Thermoanaerobaculia bacterium]|nr:serine hydrolase [Thermoanaerobaculia bacterium]